MKKIILILFLISMVAGTVFALSGTYTENLYFYLPGYGSYGTNEFDEYETYMQVADTQIEANKVMGEASVDTSGAPVQYDIARFTDADTIEGRSYAELKADLDLEIGTDVEAHDDGLLSIAGLTTAANKSIYTTALDTYAVYDLTAFARTILDDADASAVRTTIDALQDVANAIDSDHYTDSSIDHEHLAPDVISGMADVTSADVDYILIWDATDSALKKCDMAEVRGGGGATAWDDIGNPDANDEIDFGAFVIELNVENFQIGDGGANYVDFNGGNMTFAGTADIDLPNNSVDSGDLNFNFATSSSEGGEATTFNCTDNENEALACPLIFVDGATGAQGAETDGDITYNPSTGTLTVIALDLTTALPDTEVANDITVDSATSYVKSEIRLITSDANPDTTGEIKHDSTVAGFLGGAIRWFDNDSIRIIVDLETDPVDGDDDKVVAWDSAADGWYMKTDATGAGGSAITFDIGDDGGNDSVDVNEIATTGDTNSIFTEPSADKILIALANNWPGADLATNFTCTDNESEALACPIVFVDGATGTQGAETDDTDFTYNPSTGTLKVTALDLTTVLPDAEVANNITIDLATLATTITVTDNEATNENNPICFVAGADPDGGSLGIETDGDLHYNPSTGLLTATGFAGALTGNVTGNATGLVSTSNADITIQPNGTGDTIIYAPSDVVTTKTAVATLTIAEAGTVLVSCAATPYTITLPTASGHTGLRYHFIKTDANYFLITLDGDGAETFNYESSTGAPVATYARLNTYCAEVTIISDGTNWQVINEAMGQVPECRVYPSASQEIANATWTVLSLNTEVYDMGNNFNTGTYTYTFPIAGRYVVMAFTITADANMVADKKYSIRVYKNGNTGDASHVIHAALAKGVSDEVSYVSSYSANDYIVLQYRHDAGAGVDNITVGSGTVNTSLIVRLLSKD